MISCILWVCYLCSSCSPQKIGGNNEFIKLRTFQFLRKLKAERYGIGGFLRCFAGSRDMNWSQHVQDFKQLNILNQHATFKKDDTWNHRQPLTFDIFFVTMEPHVSSVRQGAFNPLLSPEDWVSQLSWATHWASESEWNKDNSLSVVSFCLGW